MFGGIYVCLVQYHRYWANPIVVSVERDFHAWNGTLPSLTFCYLDNLSPENADDYINRTWHVTQESSSTDDDGDTEKYLYYKEFLSLLLDANIYNLPALQKFSADATLKDLDLQVAIRTILSERDHYVSSFDNDLDLVPRAILTERGLCYTVNSMQADIMPLADTISEGNNNQTTSPIGCNFMQDQCFLKLDIYGFNTSIAIHSPYEPIRYENYFYELADDSDIVAAFKLLETTNDDLVRDLTLAQRKCLFYDEPQEEKEEQIMRAERLLRGDSDAGGKSSANSVYSQNLCLLKCRANRAVSLCGCKPHFYSRLIG